MATQDHMKFVSLFAGIGGLDLGLERAGMECVAQVENDPWCTQILEKHWPDVPRFGDITTLDPKELPNADLICGGFPCQPVSLAGARKAQDDERWLWPHYFRIVRALRPRYVLVENVPGLASAGMGDVLSDLASVGYDTEWQSIPAAFVGAPHLRWRIFVVAYPNSESQPGSTVDGDTRPRKLVLADSDQFRCDEPIDSQGRVDRASRSSTLAPSEQRTDRPERLGGDPRTGPILTEHPGRGTARHWAVEPDVGRVAHGIPSRVDRLRGLGNAVVPQVAEYVGRLMLTVEP